MNYFSYIIYSSNRTYIGITNNLSKRLLLHNSNKGAKATMISTNWKYKIIVGPFKYKNLALRFEWMWKHSLNSRGKWIKTKSGLVVKINRLNELLELDEWKQLKLKKILI